jgi:hypothetical protein
MYQIFLRVPQPGGWHKTIPAYRIDLSGNRLELVFEDQAEAKAQAQSIKLSIAYLANAGAKTGADVEIKEISC